jgi:hypothetical protein
MYRIGDVIFCSNDAKNVAIGLAKASLYNEVSAQKNKSKCIGSFITSSKMPRTYGLLVIFALVTTSSYAQARYPWAEKQHFEWKDFTGFPDAESPYAASVNTGLSQDFSIDHDGKLVLDSLQITAYFYPKLSWYKPKQVNADLLKHERLHFTITELHARMLRKQIARFNFTTNLRSEIRQMYQEIEQKRQKMQIDFDAQTQHGLRAEQELLWEEKVNLLLAKY